MTDRAGARQRIGNSTAAGKELPIEAAHALNRNRPGIEDLLAPRDRAADLGKWIALGAAPRAPSIEEVKRALGERGAARIESHRIVDADKERLLRNPDRPTLGTRALSFPAWLSRAC